MCSDPSTELRVRVTKWVMVDSQGDREALGPATAIVAPSLVVPPTVEAEIVHSPRKGGVDQEFCQGLRNTSHLPSWDKA